MARIHVQSLGDDEFSRRLRESLVEQLPQLQFAVEERISPATDAVLQRVKQAMREGGASFVGDDAGLFPNAPKVNADLQIAARVYAVELKTCSNLIGMQGAANVKVEWQIFSRRTNAVVLTTTTEGSFKQSEHNQTTATVIRDRAVEAAAANLNADSRYREFMMREAGRG